MIEYSFIEEADLEQIADLYEKHLNSGQWVRESIKNGFYKTDYIGVKAVCEDRIVGFFSGRSGIEFTYPHPDLEEKMQKLSGGRVIYTPDALLVLPGCRQQGVARELIHAMGMQLQKSRYELALVELWIYPDGTIPAENPLKNLGESIFKEEVPGFYRESKKYHIGCPICGEDCKCGALIEVLNLHKETGV